MKLTVNGESKSLTEGKTVRDLLAELKLDKPGVAVEVNRTLIPRKAHAHTILAAGDEIEIVSLVGGG